MLSFYYENGCSCSDLYAFPPSHSRRKINQPQSRRSRPQETFSWENDCLYTFPWLNSSWGAGQKAPVPSWDWDHPGLEKMWVAAAHTLATDQKGKGWAATSHSPLAPHTLGSPVWEVDRWFCPTAPQAQFPGTESQGEATTLQAPLLSSHAGVPGVRSQLGAYGCCSPPLLFPPPRLGGEGSSSHH